MSRSRVTCDFVQIIPSFASDRPRLDRKASKSTLMSTKNNKDVFEFLPPNAELKIAVDKAVSIVTYLSISLMMKWDMYCSQLIE